MPMIAILGITAWGVTLGVVLARKGLQVRLWARTEQEAIKLGHGIDDLALPSGITLPSQLSITSSLSEAMAGVNAVILAVPSQTMRQNTQLVRGHLKKWMLIISAAKGLEIGSNKRMSQVIGEEVELRRR